MPRSTIDWALVQNFDSLDAATDFLKSETVSKFRSAKLASQRKIYYQCRHSIAASCPYQLLLAIPDDGSPLSLSLSNTKANRKGVGMICKPFSEKDPRLDYALHDCEPLIHFALNCGAKSCPPIKTFSAKGIKSELKVATEAFLSTDDAVIIDPGSECVRISKIFKWYRDDFGRTDEEVLTFIYDHMAAEDPRRADLGILIKSGFSLDYLHYDWG